MISKFSTGSRLACYVHARTAKKLATTNVGVAREVQRIKVCPAGLEYQSSIDLLGLQA